MENRLILQIAKEIIPQSGIRIKSSDKINAPMTYGIFRPIILIPKSLNPSNRYLIRYVLLHEYCHIKNQDVLLKWLFILTLSVYWLNPFVWLMTYLSYRDIELSCDETVIRTINRQERYLYLSALLQFCSTASAMPICKFTSSSFVRERVMAIMKSKRLTFLSMVCLIFMLAITAATFTASAVNASDYLPNSAAIPNLIGMKSDQAKAVLHKMGFEILIYHM